MDIRRLILIPLLAVTALAASCGSDATAGQSSADPLPDGPRPEQLSEQNVAEARAAFNSAKADWDESGPSAYTFEIGIQTLSLMRFEVVDDVVLTGEQIDDGGDPRFVEGLPQTVEEFFGDVDKAISAFENDPGLVPDPGECGAHFNITFDPELGYPTYSDGLGPCDDGVGIGAKVIAT